MKQNQIFIWKINFLWEICCLSVNCVKKSRYKKAPVTIKFSNLLQDLSNILCTSVTSLLLLELITGCCITRMNSHLTAQAVGFICPRPLTDQRHPNPPQLWCLTLFYPNMNILCQYFPAFSGNCNNPIL